MADLSISRRGGGRPLEPNRAAYIFYPILAAAILAPLGWALFGGFKSPSELFA